MDRIPLVRRAILAERSVPVALLWTAAAIVVPTSLRWVIDRGTSGIPFVTYFPAVLLVSVLLGWRYGVVTALLSAILANRLLRPDPFLWPFGTRDLLIIALFLVSCGVIIFAGETLRRLIKLQEQARLTQEILKREILHRGKNKLTIIQSIATITARSATGEEFIEKFTSRIQALDRANALLGWDTDSAQDAGRLVDSAIQPFSEAGTFVKRGPPVILPQRSIVPLSMALHELCTNALKYGALSGPHGEVAISWEEAGTEEPELIVHWKEIGGPPVSPPKRKGLGTALLTARYPIREVKMDFPTEGVECRIVVLI